MRKEIQKRAILIRVDGTMVDLNHKPDYRELCALTSGGRANTIIERTKVRFEGRRCDCIVNEEGIPLGLPVNDKATLMYREDIKESYNGSFIDLSDAFLHGPVVIFVGWRF